MIHFFLSLIYAEPHELGWDPTMTPLDDGINYDIRLDGFNGSTRTYRTLELMSGLGLSDVRRGGTRVWKAIQLEDGERHGEPVVLKDAWVDAGRTAEGFILESIRNTDRDPNIREYFDTSFPTPLFHGDVFLDLARTNLDYTRSLWPEHDDQIMDSQTLIRLRSRNVPEDHDESAGKHPLRLKVHYRIILKEIGRSFSREQDPVIIFNQIARGAYIVVVVMSGWPSLILHRSQVLAQGRLGSPRRQFSEYNPGERPRDVTRSGVCYEGKPRDRSTHSR